jgi:DNA topoisomerase-3
MNLVIAEKDMLARDIARAMCGRPVAEDARLPIEGNGYTVCAASGHLLQLMEPGEISAGLAEWCIETLPIAFYPWPKKTGNDFAQRKLDTIAKLIAECNGTVYCAGDADDEGQLIVDEILEYLNLDPASPRFKRVYVNDNLEKNIRKAFEEARPNAECMRNGRAALARQLADMSFGVSESRLASIRLQGNVTAGRVQTPTLGLVVKRDEAREGHVTQEFFTLHACVRMDGCTADFTYKPPSDLLEDGKHCFDKDALERIAARIEGAQCSFTVSCRNVKSAPPLPYEMTSLVADMSKRFKLTANDVMEATQALRDKHHAITYNRTDSSYLKDEHFLQAPQVAPLAAGNIGCTWPVDTSIKSKAFDSSKVEVHHGIIPQEIHVPLDKLAERECDIYTAIAQRYLVQFLPPLLYTEATAAFAIDGIDGTFECTQKAMAQAGWTQFAPSGWQNVGGFCDDAMAEGIHNGSIDDAQVHSKATKPPAAFTDGTLMTAMANVAKYVRDPEVKRILLEKDAESANEHGSIGTTATRKDIIEGLIAHGYLIRKGSSLVSTDKARRFYKLIPDAIKGVDLTARWWLMQQRIAAGEAAPNAIMADVCSEFDRHKDTAYANATLSVEVGTCPICGAAVIERGKAFSCISNKSQKQADGTFEDIAGCGFKIFPFGGKKLTPKQVASLLDGKAVPLKGCISKKTGSKYDCKVLLEKGGKGKLKPIFDAPSAKGRPGKAGSSQYTRKRKARW